MLNIENLFKKGKVFGLYVGKDLYVGGKVFNVEDKKVLFKLKNGDIVVYDINSPNIVFVAKTFFSKARSYDLLKYKKEDIRFSKILNKYLSTVPIISKENVIIKIGNRFVIKCGYFFYTAKVIKKKEKELLSVSYTVKLDANGENLDIPFFSIIGRSNKRVKKPIPLNKLPQLLSEKYVEGLTDKLLKIMAYGSKFVPSLLSEKEEIDLIDVLSSLKEESLRDILTPEFLGKMNKNIKTAFYKFIPNKIFTKYFPLFFTTEEDNNLLKKVLVSRLKSNDIDLINIALKDPDCDYIAVGKIKDSEYLFELFQEKIKSISSSNKISSKTTLFIQNIILNIDPSYFIDIFNLLSKNTNNKILADVLSKFVSLILERINPKDFGIILENKKFFSKEVLSKAGYGNKKYFDAYRKVFSKVFENIESSKIVDTAKKYQDFLEYINYDLGKFNHLLFRMSRDDILTLLEESKPFNFFFTYSLNIFDTDRDSILFLSKFSRDDILYMYNNSDAFKEFLDRNFNFIIDNFYKNRKNPKMDYKEALSFLKKDIKLILLLNNIPLEIVPSKIKDYFDDEISLLVSLKEESYNISKVIKDNINNKETLENIIKYYLNKGYSKLSEGIDIPEDESFDDMVYSLLSFNLLKECSPVMYLIFNMWFDSSNNNYSYIIKRLFGDVIYQDSQEKDISEYKFLNENKDLLNEVSEGINFLRILNKILFKKIYKNKEVTLYRGFFLKPNSSDSIKENIIKSIKKECYVYTNPLSSWTEDDEIANNFSIADSIIFSVIVENIKNISIDIIKKFMETYGLNVVFETKTDGSDIIFFYKMFKYPFSLKSYESDFLYLSSESEFVLFSQNNKRKVKVSKISM